MSAAVSLPEAPALDRWVGTVPDPGAYVAHPALERAVGVLERAVRRGDRRVLLTGPAGHGKTLALRLLRDRIGGQLPLLEVPFLAVEPDDAARWLLAQTRAPRPFDSEGALLLWLEERARRSGRVVVVLDELHTAPPATAARIFSLLEESDVVSLVAAGTDGSALRELLRELPQPATRVVLDAAWSRHEVDTLLARVQVAALPAQRAALATLDAGELLEQSDGIPPRIRQCILATLHHAGLLLEEQPGEPPPIAWAPHDPAPVAVEVGASEPLLLAARTGSEECAVPATVQRVVPSTTSSAPQATLTPRPRAPRRSGPPRLPIAAPAARRAAPLPAQRAKGAARAGAALAARGSRAAVRLTAIALGHLRDRIGRSAGLGNLPHRLRMRATLAGFAGLALLAGVPATGALRGGESAPIAAVADAGSPAFPNAVAPTPTPVMTVPAVAVVAPTAASQPTQASRRLQPDPAIAEPVPAGADEASLAAEIEVAVNALPWARIAVDGNDAGATPLSLALAPGLHRFRAELADGRVIERDVEVGTGPHRIAFR